MIIYDNYLDGLNIFYSNLPCFHICSMIISWLAFGINLQKIFPSKKNDKSLSEEVTPLKKEANSLQTQYKLARQKIAEQNLTPEQRSKEKEAEAQQLAAILKLLQEKSDTFHVDSMDQLEDQLKLYRK